MKKEKFPLFVSHVYKPWIKDLMGDILGMEKGGPQTKGLMVLVSSWG